MPTPIPPSTSPQTPVTTNAPSVESAAPAVKPEKPQPQTPKEDPKTAAKNAQASKQLGMAKKNQNDWQGQVVKNDLANRVPDKDKNAGSGQTAKGGTTSSVPPKASKTGSAYGWEDLGRDVGHATVSAAKTSKTEKSTGATKPPQSKETPKQESESLWETMKTAGKVVVNMPAVAGAAADAALESGGDAIRRQKLENLIQRKHPQDIVPGQMFEVEDIWQNAPRDKPGDKNINKIDVKKNTEVVESRVGTIKVGDQEYDVGPPIPKWVDHPSQNRSATKAELEERLKELNGGGPITDFEKKLASEFGPRQLRLTPIKEVDSKGEKMSKEVQAYKVKDGGGADYETKYYDRNGNVLKDMGMRGGAVESMGLGPLEYAGIAALGKHVFTKVAGKILAKKEAETVVKAEIGAATRTGAKAEADAAVKAGTGAAAKAETAVGSRSVDPRAATQPQQAGVAKDAPTLNTVGPALPPSRPMIEPRPIIEAGWTATRPGSFSTSLAPMRTDKVLFSIKTPKGVEKMTGLEYRLRMNEAEGWVIKNRPIPKHVGQGPSRELYKEAQVKFGLNDGWETTWNPMRKKIEGV